MIARDRTSGDLQSLRQSLVRAAWIHFFAGDLAECRSYTEQIIDVAHTMGNPGGVMGQLGRLADILHLMGDWQQARPCLREAEVVRQSLEDPIAHCDFSLQWDTHVLWEGDWEAAARHPDEAIQVGKRLRYVENHLGSQFHRALVDLEQNRPNEAHTCLTDLAQGSERHAVGMVAVMWALAWACLEMGNLDQAESWAVRSVEQAIAHRNMLDLSIALRIRGRVFTGQGRWQKAEESFEEALTLLPRIECPAARAATLYERGRMRAAMGDHAGASRSLREAQRMFTRLGARKEVERIDQVLADVREETARRRGS